MQPYMSGLMLGASIGKAMHNMLFQKQSMAAGRGGRPAPKKSPAAVREEKPEMTEYTLVSASKGRRRYSVPSLHNNEEMAALLEEKLGQLKCIKSVKTNPVTGSLLLVFQCNPQKIEFLMYRLFGNKCGEAKKPHGKKRAAVGNSLCGSVKAMDKTLCKNTANCLDLSTVISLFFIVRGLRKMILLGQSPSGPQMLWWAFTLMRGRRSE